jgi:MFS family permease
MSPRALILWGSVIAAVGTLVTMFATDLYGLVLGFSIASLGFGFTRPGFTGGASLAVPLAEQGGVAGVITAANGIAYVAAPTVGMLLYAVDPHWPFVVSAALLVGLLLWGQRALRAASISA